MGRDGGKVPIPRGREVSRNDDGIPISRRVSTGNFIHDCRSFRRGGGGGGNRRRDEEAARSGASR